MPGFHALAHDMGRARHHLADGAGIDQRPRLLVGAAEEGVGGAADHQPAFLGGLFEVEPVLERQHQRLFRIGVLAGASGCPW